MPTITAKVYAICAAHSHHDLLCIHTTMPEQSICAYYTVTCHPQYCTPESSSNRVCAHMNACSTSLIHIIIKHSISSTEPWHPSCADLPAVGAILRPVPPAGAMYNGCCAKRFMAPTVVHLGQCHWGTGFKRLAAKCVKRQSGRFKNSCAGRDSPATKPARLLDNTPLVCFCMVYPCAAETTKLCCTGAGAHLMSE